jgi:hypothetical protein
MHSWNETILQKIETIYIRSDSILHQHASILTIQIKYRRSKNTAHESEKKFDSEALAIVFAPALSPSSTSDPKSEYEAPELPAVFETPPSEVGYPTGEDWYPDGWCLESIVGAPSAHTRFFIVK